MVKNGPHGVWTGLYRFRGSSSLPTHSDSGEGRDIPRLFPHPSVSVRLYLYYSLSVFTSLSVPLSLCFSFSPLRGL